MKFSGISARLTARLFPVLGPPPLGPFDEEHATVKPCPLCGAAMDAHEIERTPGRPTRLHCPAPTTL